MKTRKSMFSLFGSFFRTKRRSVSRKKTHKKRLMKKRVMKGG